MRRREFIAAIASVSLCPMSARAQHKAARIGFLNTASLESPEGRATLGAFRQGLRELGYTVDQNVFLEVRVANSIIERFPALASELVGLDPDVIVAGNSVA